MLGPLILSVLKNLVTGKETRLHVEELSEEKIKE